MEYPFKDLLPLDEVLEREGYYKDWTHLDPEVFYSLTQISEYIKTKGYGVDVRLLIAQLAEHFGLKTTQVVDLGNLIQAEHATLKQQVQQAVAQVNADRNALETKFNQSVAKMEADKNAVIANATVDSEVILARGGKPTLGARLDETTAQLAQTRSIDEYKVNAKSPLVTPTYDGSYQSVHPKVLVFPQGWNGHVFWMAMTPYTNTNDKTENPSILVSDDSYRWYEPEGIQNPISGIPNPGGGGHYSDTHLVMVNGVMELWYRYNPPLANGQGNDNNTNIIYRQTSTDGINWTEKETIFNETGYARPYASPSIIFENGLYKIWWLDYDWQIFYQESTNAINWTQPVLNTTDLPSHALPWHADVIRHGDGFEMVLSCRTSTNPTIFELYYLQSDDGVNWKNSQLIISPSLDSNFMDNLQIYRASIVRAYGLVKIYYSSTTRDGRWFTSLTEGKTIDSLQGYNGQDFFPKVLHSHLYLKDTSNLFFDIDGKSSIGNINGRMTIKGGNDTEVSNEKGRFMVTKPTVGSSYLDHDGLFFNDNRGGTSLMRDQLTVGDGTHLKNNELVLSAGGSNAVMAKQSATSQRTMEITTVDALSGFIRVGAIYLTGSYGALENVEGTLRYNATLKKLEFYNGTKWETVQSS